MKPSLIVLSMWMWFCMNLHFNFYSIALCKCYTLVIIMSNPLSIKNESGWYRVGNIFSRLIDYTQNLGFKLLPFTWLISQIPMYKIIYIQFPDFLPSNQTIYWLEEARRMHPGSGATYFIQLRLRRIVVQKMPFHFIMSVQLRCMCWSFLFTRSKCLV